MEQLILSSIPKKYANIYTDKVGNFLLVYAPLSEQGLTVLSPESAWLFDQIDCKKTLNQILRLARVKNRQITSIIIIKIFRKFLASEIIYFNSPKTEIELKSKNPSRLSVWLHLTNQCNLRCVYCYVWKSQGSMSLTTAKKAMRKIVSGAKKHGFAEITVKFSGGECLLVLDRLLQIVTFSKKLAQENQIGITFVVMTNGVLITNKVARIFKKNNFRVVVSLDGLGKYHDKQRIFPGGKGSFMFVEKGIDALQKFKIPFNVSVTITDYNVTNVPELTRCLLDKNIAFTYNFFRENPHVSEKLKGDDKKLIKYLIAAYRLIAKRPPRHSLINGLLDRVVFQKPHLHTCGVGQNYVVVRHDGKIVSCQMTLEKPIGSVNDSDVIETMMQGNFIRPKGLNVLGKSLCKNCQWRYICGGGCPLLTFSQKGKYSLSSPYCTIYKSLIPEVLRVEAKRLINYGEVK